MRLVDLLRLTKARLTEAGLADGATMLATEVLGVTADSRAVTPGLLFAALPGSRADGRAFIGAAVLAGAVAVLAPEGTAWPAGVPPRPMLWSADVRRALALAAAALAGPQPTCVVAVTGTNGKTSTVEFLRQLWTLDGKRAASIGTLGLVAEGFPPGPSLTTPDPVALHAMLAALAKAGVTHVAMEASSHGLDQRRLDGVELRAAGFTNLTRDHLDYHSDMAGYAAAKLRLFDSLLPIGAVAAASLDLAAVPGEALRGLHRQGRCTLLSVGENAGEVHFSDLRALPDGQELTVFARDTPARRVKLLLPGRFQVQNALLALALAIGCGMPAARGLDLLPKLRGVRGRLELAARLPNGAAVYVDYAHTPDGLRTLLTSLRPHTQGRLLVVFGAGGDRDPGKRPLMGAACAELADRCFVTDDNPRGENPAVIRAAILAGTAAPGSEAIEISDRRAAIATAMAELLLGDVLVVAGKGHESGQTVAGVTRPFDDAQMVRELALPALWTSSELRAATGGSLAAELAITGIAIDSRAVRPGDLFIALRDARDGHDFVAAALAAGASCAMVDHEPSGLAATAPLLRVADTLAGLTALGAAGRARSRARVAAITGSVGKTTTKDMLHSALAACGSTHAAVASYNNHWGVPLTLARLPRDAAFAVLEIGMNRRGEIAPLARLARPDVAVVTNIGTAHLGHLGSQAAIAREKADIFAGLAPSGIGIYPADGEFAPLLRDAAGPGAIGFGEAPCDARLMHYAGTGDGGVASVKLGGETWRVALASPGRHLALNLCAALAAASALGAPLAQATAGLATFAVTPGRGARRPIAVSGGEALLLDDSYNASVASILAAVAVLAVLPARRRVAVLGDMRELGERGPALHAGLAAHVGRDTDLVFCCGPLMKHLFDELPVDKRGAHAADSTSLAPLVKACLRPGDVVLVKGSLGSDMAVVIRALTESAQ